MIRGVAETCLRCPSDVGVSLGRRIVQRAKGNGVDNCIRTLPRRDPAGSESRSRFLALSVRRTFDCFSARMEYQNTTTEPQTLTKVVWHVYIFRAVTSWIWPSFATAVEMFSECAVGDLE